MKDSMHLRGPPSFSRILLVIHDQQIARPTRLFRDSSESSTKFLGHRNTPINNKRAPRRIWWSRSGQKWRRKWSLNDDAIILQ